MTIEEISKTLQSKKVGIAGCGGLGSNCAVALVRTGLHSLLLVDYDVITVDNLNRQYYFLDQVGMKKVNALRENILRINPGLNIVVSDCKLESADVPLLFSGCDVVVEAFDLADQKMMLIETMLEFLPHIPVVSGNGMAGWGRTNILSSQKIDNLYICGDGISEVGPGMPPLAPRVGIVAHMQANAVLEILLNS